MIEPGERERKLQRLNLILRTIRMVDQIILEEGDRDRLIKEVCDSLVKTQGYFNAWIALLDESGRFTTFAEAGLGEKFSALAEQLKGGRLTSCGESALTQAKAVVINDPASSCTDCPLAKEYIGRGGITARIQYRGKLYGLLCASVPASLITVAEERSLFKDVAGDIAFALHEIEVEEQHEQVEKRLQRLNLILRTIRKVDQIILEEGDRDRLIKEVCDSLVKTQGYFNAWIALLDESGRFTTFAEAGLGEKFSALAEQLESGRLTSCGESALTHAKAVVINDPASSCTDCPLAKEYIGRGGITARIQYRGKLYGLLCASVPASLITVAEERSLFKDVARDIASALRKMELEEEREHTEWALRAYARRAISAQEEERRRVARELHDGTAQDLASLGMDIDSLARTEGLTVKDISKGLEMLRDRTDDILRGVRSLSHGLRPPMLEEFGLMVALQGLIDDLATQSGVDAKFEVRGTPRRLSPEVEITLFRIAQEGLNNIGKHAWATRAILEVEFKRDRTRLRIRDNGQGFALPASLDDLGGSDTLGLAGMRERAKLINGTLTIWSEPGKGVTLALEVHK